MHGKMPFPFANRPSGAPGRAVTSPPEGGFIVMLSTFFVLLTVSPSVNFLLLRRFFFSYFFFSFFGWRHEGIKLLEGLEQRASLCYKVGSESVRNL